MTGNDARLTPPAPTFSFKRILTFPGKYDRKIWNFIIDGFVKSRELVIPDLIRNLEHIEITLLPVLRE